MSPEESLVEEVRYTVPGTAGTEGARYENGTTMITLKKYQGQIDQLQPWEGEVPKGYLVDFLGMLTDGCFRVDFGVVPSAIEGGFVRTTLPRISDGGNAEAWFEAVNWLNAAREAHERYVMVCLGACYGGPVVSAYRMLQMVNPLPCKLVAVEPEPDNFDWMMRHFHANDLEPTDHWLVQMAVAGTNDPILFPVGAPGTGAQNCITTNEAAKREEYAMYFIRTGKANEAILNLMRHNSTGLTTDLVPGKGFKAEVKYMSAITLRDLLSPFDVVDYLDSDIQQSEINVFPPSMDVLRRKVKLVHIGTHGKDVHETLRALFAANGWEILFCFEPNATHTCDLGTFDTNDGILTARNPTL